MKCTFNARKDLDSFREGSTQESGDLICVLRDVTVEIAKQGEPTPVTANFSTVIDDNPNEVESRCNRLVLHDFNNYRRHLVSWDKYYELVSDFCAEVGLSEDPSTFVRDLKQTFVERPSCLMTRFRMTTLSY